MKPNYSFDEILTCTSDLVGIDIPKLKEEMGITPKAEHQFEAIQGIKSYEEAMDFREENFEDLEKKPLEFLDRKITEFGIRIDLISRYHQSDDIAVKQELLWTLFKKF